MSQKFTIRLLTRFLDMRDVMYQNWCWYTFCMTVRLPTLCLWSWQEERKSPDATPATVQITVVWCYADDLWQIGHLMLRRWPRQGVHDRWCYAAVMLMTEKEKATWCYAGGFNDRWLSDGSTLRYRLIYLFAWMSLPLSLFLVRSFGVFFCNGFLLVRLFRFSRLLYV